MSVKLAWTKNTDPRSNCDAYDDAMLELMDKDQRYIHIDCDLLGCINGKRIKSAHPDRLINAGIAEANAVGVAAGLASTGFIPFVHSFGVFSARRAFDQAFLSAGYSRWPVHILGTDPGVTAGANGATHMPFEDGALYMSVPNAVVLDPCDYAQTYALTKKSAAYPELTYMRMIRKKFKTVYADGTDFEIGKGIVLREGTDVTIIASGIMVNNALEAEELLRKEGISAAVIDMFTWKPLDEELIFEYAKKTGAVVTAENHQAYCGLGSAVANVLAKNCPVPQEFIGIQNLYGQAASQDYLEKVYGLTAEDIAKAAKKAIGRK